MDYREKVLYLLNQHNQSTKENISSLAIKLDTLQSQLKNFKEQFSSYVRVVGVPDCVDLDLPSGTLWLKKNVGARTETDPGLYFQWGDIAGSDYSNAKTHSTWGTCPGNGGNKEANTESLTAWDKSHLNDISTALESSIFNNRSLDSSADACMVSYSNICCMPSKEQFDELIKYTNIEFPKDLGDFKNQIYKFSSKKDPSKYIIIPGAPLADGAVGGAGVFEGGNEQLMVTKLWSSSIKGDDITKSYCLFLYPTNGSVSITYENRSSAYFIRGILTNSRL